MGTYTYPTYPYQRSPDQDRPADRPAHHRVVVVGAGPVGLTAALDLVARGVDDVVLLDDDTTVSVGSRAICWAKRPLEIWNRLGCARDLVDRGVTWQIGRVFHRDREVYHFDLLPESGHEMPAFINLQQYHVEEDLIGRCRAAAGVDVRFANRVTGVRPAADHVALEVDTPDGPHGLSCDWLIACDGAKSPVRKMLGLGFEGQVFEDRFLIADVHMTADFPTERWFWFDPPFHPGQSALLHRQADNVWRIDLQLGWDADPEAERKPERVIPRLRRMLGPDAEFELEWTSVYTFQCRRLARFRHGRVLFAGDSAHQVSPFGARGGNTGIQDIDNLAWKLALVIDGTAPEALLDSYDQERVAAADDNIGHSTRATDFITPKSRVSRAFRDATLALAADHEFARALVNSGRLSTPTVLADSPLNTPDSTLLDSPMVPGTPAADAPVTPVRGGDAHWLLGHLGRGFTVMVFGAVADDLPRPAGPVPVDLLTVLPAEGPDGGGSHVVRDRHHTAARRYAGRPGTTYLFRPDQHVAGRWDHYDPATIAAALARATAQLEESAR